MKISVSKMAVLLLCASLLGACSQSSQGTKTSQTSKSSAASQKSQKKESKASSSSSEEKKVDCSLYDGVIDKYAEVMGSSSATPAADINPEARAIYETTDKGITYQSQGYQGIGYTLVDLDKNGTDELVISLLHQDENSLLDIYTIKDKKLIRLTSADQGMDKIGVHQAVRLLPDGKFLFVVGLSMFNRIFLVYQINAEGDSFENIFTTESLNEAQEKFGKELDLKSYDWTLVTERPGAPKTTTSSSSTTDSSQAQATTPASTGMDIAAIQNGDFSSIAGTWQNAKGYSYTFDANGLVSGNGFMANGQGSYIRLDLAKVENGVLKAAEAPTSPGPGGAMIYFIPKGVSLPDAVMGDQTFVDASDASRDRVYVTQNDANQAMNDYFMYKVD